MPDFAKITIPLYVLSSTAVEWKWAEKEENTFKMLKAALINLPCLRVLTPNDQIILETDASDYAIGAMLMQEADGNMHPIGYFSKKLSLAQINYTIHEKKTLAIVEALEH